MALKNIFFPLDTDIFTDIRIRKLANKHSGNAIAVYLFFLCKVYDKGYYLTFYDDLFFEAAEATATLDTTVRDIFDSCLSVGLFDEDMFKRHCIITSKSIQLRYTELSKIRRRKKSVTDYSLLPPEEPKESPPKVEQPKVINIIDPEPIIHHSNNNYFDDLLRPSMQRDLICMRFKISADDLPRLLEEFDIECRCKTIEHFTKQDANNHFVNWLRQYTKLNNGTTENNKRKGIQAVSSEPSAYGGAF